MIENKKTSPKTAKATNIALESAIERISDFSSGDAENAAHISVIRALWEYIPVDARGAAVKAITAIVAESEDIRY